MLTIAGGGLRLILGQGMLAGIDPARARPASARHRDHMDAVVVCSRSDSLLVGLLIGLVPVLQLRHLADLNRAFRKRAAAARRSCDTHDTAGCRHSQVAFAFMLLVGAGLLFTSFGRVWSPSTRGSGRRCAHGPGRASRRATGGRRPADVWHAAARARPIVGAVNGRPGLASVRRRLQRQRDPGRGLPAEAGRVADLATAST